METSSYYSYSNTSRSYYRSNIDSVSSISSRDSIYNYKKIRGNLVSYIAKAISSRGR